MAHLQSTLNPFNTVSSSDWRLVPPREDVASARASLSPCLPASVKNISRSICMEHIYVKTNPVVRPCVQGYICSKVS